MIIMADGDISPYNTMFATKQSGMIKTGILQLLGYVNKFIYG